MIENEVGDLPLQAVTRLLDLHALGEDELLVSYPPGAPWRQFGSDDFREGFSFFKDNQGTQLAEGSTFTSLPDVMQSQLISWEPPATPRKSGTTKRARQP